MLSLRFYFQPDLPGIIMVFINVINIFIARSLEAVILPNKLKKKKPEERYLKYVFKK